MHSRSKKYLGSIKVRKMTDEKKKKENEKENSNWNGSLKLF
jgi:hypothetical protein